MVAYGILVVAILLEVMATLMLPLTENFSKLFPTLALACLYIISFYLLTFVIKQIPLSIVYASWSGVGIFLVALISYEFFGDVLRWQAVVGLVFIVIGVVLVNYFSTPSNY